MYNFKIICDNGDITVLRASTRSAAIKLYLEAMGCSEAWFEAHCKVKKIFYTKTEFKLTDTEEKKTC